MKEVPRLRREYLYPMLAGADCTDVEVKETKELCLCEYQKSQRDLESVQLEIILYLRHCIREL